jgi:lysophospholipase
MPLRTMIAIVATLIVMAEPPSLHAISEEDYPAAFRAKVLPFLGKGERFTFESADGRHELSGVIFPHPEEKGLIVVVNGRSESWLKYGEIFHDLYRKGFSVASYDHRGQGLSPRLLPGNPQIGQVDDFALYGRDLGTFLEALKRVHKEQDEKIYLLAHSMGAAVAVDYLSQHPSPFRAMALTSPMFRINTAPYPEPVATMVVGMLDAIGLGRAYAPGEHDRDPAETFPVNRITTSRSRWEAIREVWNGHPAAVVGGASSDWVLQAVRATRRIRDTLPSLRTKTLILQSGQDRFVINEPPPPGENFRALLFPGARHELLMESDPIRKKALAEIVGFFENSR